MLSKETYVNQKRPAWIKRDLCKFKEVITFATGCLIHHAANSSVLLSTETYVNHKRLAWIKRDLCKRKEAITFATGCLMRHAGNNSVLLSKETYVNQKRPAWIKRDLCKCKEAITIATGCSMRHAWNSSIKRPTIETALWWLLSKETYVNQKRPAYIKRDICNPKETITMAKGCLICHAGKSSVMLSKETYVNQKRPVEILKKKISLFERAARYMPRRKSFCGVIKRDLHQKQFCVDCFQKRPVSIKRDLCKSKEAITIWKGCSVYATRETSVFCCQKRPVSEIVLWCCQKRPMSIKRDVCTPKETITIAKGCSICHAGNNSVMLSKETYVNQKRPVYIQ